MQLLNFENTNSESKIIYSNLKILSKIKCIGEVLRYGRKATPSTKFAKQIDFFENLKLSNSNKIGDLQNA